MGDKMQGDIWRKFASLRTLYSYMTAHPGAKLNFMGNEFGQFIEWRFYEQLEWFMLEYDHHRMLHDYVKKLNALYLESPELWECDDSWHGFRWNTVNDADNCIYAFTRIADSGSNMLVVLNMTPSTFADYRIGVLPCEAYETVLDSDSPVFGGSGFLNSLNANHHHRYENTACNDFEGSIVVDIPPNAALFMKTIERS